MYNDFSTSNRSLFRVTRKQLWLAFLFPTLFLADILYGLLDYYGFSSPVSPGIFLRGFALFLAVTMILKYRYCIPQHVFRWCLGTLLLTFPSIIYSFAVGCTYDIGRDILYILRAVYGPLMILLVIILIRIYSISVQNFLAYIEGTAYLLGITLLISRNIGIERLTYGTYAYGDTGVFYAQNDLSLTFGLTLLAASYRVIEEFSITRCLLLILSIWSCLQIGTKASAIVIVINALFIITLAVWGETSSRGGWSHRQKKSFFPAFVISGIMIILSGYGFILQSQSSYQKEKIEKILINRELPRSMLITSGLYYFQKRALFLHVTGEGMVSYMSNLPAYLKNQQFTLKEKNVEVDFIDFIGAYGVFFSVIIHLFFFVLLYVSFKSYIRTRDNIYGAIFVAVCMYTGHSLLAGHAMCSPTPTTLIAGYAGFYFRNKNAKKKTVNN